jgi:hypothetical protein
MKKNGKRLVAALAGIGLMLGLAGAAAAGTVQVDITPQIIEAYAETIATITLAGRTFQTGMPEAFEE